MSDDNVTELYKTLPNGQWELVKKFDYVAKVTYSDGTSDTKHASVIAAKSHLLSQDYLPDSDAEHETAFTHSSRGKTAQIHVPNQPHYKKPSPNRRMSDR